MSGSKRFPSLERSPGVARVGEVKRAEDARSARGSSDPFGGGDGVSIDARTEALLSPTAEAERIDETRRKRIETLKRAVAESRYVVSAQLVADRMLVALSRSSREI